MRVLVERIPRRLRPVLVGVGIGAAFVLVWLARDEHTARPELLSGTVIWSNEETRRNVVEVGGRDNGTREYYVAAQQWTDADGTVQSHGYPSCPVAHPGDPIRTDRRCRRTGSNSHTARWARGL
ncbi:hypothetical protein KRMM14A1259_45150 [Krasilnikovia sp. MM14-A1259]